MIATLVSLDARLFVVRDDRDVGVVGVALSQHGDLAIDAQDFGHLCLERFVAPFEIVADLVGFHLVAREDFADRTLNDIPQAGMSSRRRMSADVARQQPRRPELVRIPQLLGLLAGQRDQPRACLIGDRCGLAGTRAVLECRHHTKPNRAIETAQHGLMRHPDCLAHRMCRRVRAIGQQHPRSRNPARRFRARPRDPLQPADLFVSDRYLDNPPWCRHRRRAIMLRVELTSPYNMWCHSGNPAQRVGFMESVY